VEGKLYNYGDRFNAVPHPWLWWKDTLAQAAYGSHEVSDFGRGGKFGTRDSSTRRGRVAGWLIGDQGCWGAKEGRGRGRLARHRVRHRLRRRRLQRRRSGEAGGR
jgi:hypothetical protein